MRLVVAALAMVLAAGQPQGFAQVGKEPSSLAFDVASVRQNVSGDEKVYSNVPLGPGDVFAATGGMLVAGNWPVASFIYFAYRMTDAQVEFFKKQVPGWVLTDRFDIQAKTDKPDVTKAEMRLMMRALLAERFGLAVHYEAREMPVYELLPVKSGQLGPGLRVHPASMACAAIVKDLSLAGKPETAEGGFVSYCGGITGLPATGKGNYRIGASQVSMKLIADPLTLWGGLGKAAVDRTGLTGDYDFVLEWAPLGAPDKEVEAVGPTFVEALKKQLGLRLEAGKGPVELLVLDHIGPLTQN